MKKLLYNIYALWVYFMNGMKSATHAMFASVDHTKSDDGHIEQRVENDNVIKQLLRGELTEEVKQLRYETYAVLEASKKYRYNGNGRANTLFNRKIESECKEIPTPKENRTEYGYDVRIVQNNSVDNGTMDDNLKNNGDIYKNYTIHIERDFIPKHRLERYCTKIVVLYGKDNDDVLLDLYVPTERERFNNVAKFFYHEIEELEKGAISHSDIVNGIKELYFVSDRASNDFKDLVRFSFNNIVFSGITKNDNMYVFRFRTRRDEDTEYDIAKEVHNEAAEKKFRNKEKREDAIASFEDMSIMQEEKRLNELLEKNSQYLLGEYHKCANDEEYMTEETFAKKKNVKKQSVVG